MTRALGDRYGAVFSRAMQRDVDPVERAALCRVLDDLSGDIRAAHGSRRRPARDRGPFAALIWEAIDERLHGRGGGLMAAARMIGYIRVSTDEQAASGLGMTDQEKTLVIEADRRGWALSLVVDAGESGSTLERPGLKLALEQLARHDADGLIVAKLDRLSRSVIDFGLLLEWFDELGVRLVALDLGVDSSTAGGRLVANVFAAVAEWERDTIRERTRRALAELRAQGKPTGRPAVADQPELAARIHTMRAQGMSLQKIADRLNADGVPTLRGAERWQKSAVQAATGYQRPKRRRRRTDLPAPARARAG